MEDPNPTNATHEGQIIDELQGRVILAEAMGLPILDEELPNPFIHANRDYAVLQWMISQGINSHIFKVGCLVLNGYPTYRYQIGNYARGALKALEEQENSNG